MSSTRVRFIFLGLCLLLASAAAHASGIVLVVGDSIGAAYGLPRERGWVQLLAERLKREARDYTVVNASISGETTLGGRNRLDKLLATHRPAIVVVQLGGNDGLRGASPEAMGENLRAMASAIAKAGSTMLLVGIRLPPNYGAAYTQRFEAVYAQVAKAERVALVPYLFAGFGERTEMFQDDGIHPKAQAQPLMAETVWSALAPLLKRR